MAEQQDYDSPWKDILDLQFEEFMAFFFPSAHARIDWRAGHEFLDKELQKITLDAALGRRMVDKLVKVHLTDGQEQWVLVHVEVQTQPALGFPERMFVYHYRIRDRFDARCATFGVLADGDPAWRPAEFRDELLGTELVLRFSTAKLLDYEADMAALEGEANPFALVVLAHAGMRATTGDPRARLDKKFGLTRRLFERGYTREQIVSLYRFIDWMMLLPEDLELEYDRRVDAYQEERKMEYLSSMERRAMERGRQDGIQEGVQQGMQQGMQQGELSGRAATVRRQLTRRLGVLSKEDEQRVRSLSVAMLDRLADDLLDFTEAADLQRWFARYVMQ
jgi:hypothetical protein